MPLDVRGVHESQRGGGGGAQRPDDAPHWRNDANGRRHDVVVAVAVRGGAGGVGY